MEFKTKVKKYIIMVLAAFMSDVGCSAMPQFDMSKVLFQKQDKTGYIASLTKDTLTITLDATSSLEAKAEYAKIFESMISDPLNSVPLVVDKDGVRYVFSPFYDTNGFGSETKNIILTKYVKGKTFQGYTSIQAKSFVDSNGNNLRLGDAVTSSFFEANTPTFSSPISFSLTQDMKRHLLQMMQGTEDRPLLVEKIHYYKSDLLSKTGYYKYTFIISWGKNGVDDSFIVSSSYAYLTNPTQEEKDDCTNQKQVAKVLTENRTPGLADRIKIIPKS